MADMRRDDELIPGERRAIRDLRTLASRWPDTLKLFSAAGSLIVLPADYDCGPDGRLDPAVVLAYIDGIPNDGGDPW